MAPRDGPSVGSVSRQAGTPPWGCLTSPCHVVSLASCLEPPVRGREPSAEVVLALGSRRSVDCVQAAATPLHALQSCRNADAARSLRLGGKGWPHQVGRSTLRTPLFSISRELLLSWFCE